MSRKLCLLWAAWAASFGCDAGTAAGLPPAPLASELDPQLSAAVSVARSAVLERPEQAQPWLVLGMTYEGGDLLLQARTCYERSLALQDDAKGSYRLSVVCAKMGEGALAVAAIERALRAAPDYAPAYWRLGNYLFDLGNFERALASYQSAVRLDPSFFGAWTGIARTLLQEEKTEQAIGLLERLRRENPEDAHVLKLLQAAYVQGGRAEAAALEVAWQANASPGRDPWQAEFRPYHVRPLLERAREHLKGGRAAEALALLEPFVAEGSEDWNAHVYLARAYRDLERVEDARRTVERALAHDPDNVLVLRERARLEEGSGDARAALATLERILVLDPMNAEGRRARERLAAGLAGAGR